MTKVKLVAWDGDEPKVKISCSLLQDKWGWSLGQGAPVRNVVRFWNVLAFHEAAFQICTVGNVKMQEQMRDAVGGAWQLRSFQTKMNTPKKVTEEDLAEGDEQLYLQLYYFIVHDVTFCCLLPDEFLDTVATLIEDFRTKCNDKSCKVTFNAISFAVQILLALALPLLDHISVSSFCTPLASVVTSLPDAVTYPGIIIPMLMFTCRLLDYPAAQHTALQKGVVRTVLRLMSETTSLYRLTLMARILYKASEHPQYIQHVTDIAVHFNMLIGIASKSAKPVVCVCAEEEPELHENSSKFPALLQASILLCLLPVVDCVCNIDIECLMCCWHLRQEGEDVRKAALIMCTRLTEMKWAQNPKLSNAGLQHGHWKAILSAQANVDELRIVHALAERAHKHVAHDNTAITPELVSEFISRLEEKAEALGAWALKTAVELLQCLQDPAPELDVMQPILRRCLRTGLSEGAEALEPAARLLEWFGRTEPRACGELLVEVMAGVAATKQYQLYDKLCSVADTCCSLVKLEVKTVEPLIARLMEANPVVQRTHCKDQILRVLRLLAAQGHMDLIKKHYTQQSDLNIKHLGVNPPEPPVQWTNQ